MFRLPVSALFCDGLFFVPEKTIVANHKRSHRQFFSQKIMSSGFFGSSPLLKKSFLENFAFY